ncbi:MAG: ATP-dependent DNA helicase RecG, partial [Candidatus Izimaplasma sp.]|nr:ATP-dependent DNA helicase RecG [Candidatus Izimaplasma bacterium]
NILSPGTEIVITGKIDRLKKTITAQTLKLERNFNAELEPIYNIDGISDNQFNKLVNIALEDYRHSFKDDLPKNLIEKYKLLSYTELLYKAHNPTSKKDLQQIDRRIKYEELFKFQFKMQYIRLKNKMQKESAKHYDINHLKSFIKTLPFELTNDQKKATNEIIKDIRSKFTMNRLLQGDTGSGKTIVSVIVSFAVIDSGYQVALMAPTEILAKQHFMTFKTYFKHTNIKVVYLSGKLSKQKRDTVKQTIESDLDTIIIGTHALFSEDISFKKLGFIITDEQHRFGVKQREKLRKKGHHPDILYMSATPIPRTLAISVFGDMDISTIKEKPKSRRLVETKLFSSKQLDLVHLIIREELEKNRQIFVVTPLILESDTLDLNNATNVYNTMRKKFKDYKVAILHSKIKSEKKDQIMMSFQQHDVDILISTTVIEVGVDIPNASLMVVLDSERFGLSQLHQLRGRVGRGDKKGYCLLVYNETKDAKERLELLEKVNDGFILSEHDLRLRGAGDFFGKRQSGLLNFEKADIIKDKKILELARQDTLNILTNRDAYYDKTYENMFAYLKSSLKKNRLD